MTIAQGGQSLIDSDGFCLGGEDATRYTHIESFERFIKPQAHTRDTSIDDQFLTGAG